MAAHLDPEPETNDARHAAGKTSRTGVLAILGIAAVVVSLLAACQPTRTIAVRPGTNEVTISTAPNAAVSLYDQSGHVVPTLDLTDPVHPVSRAVRKTGSDGNLIMRYVTAGTGYTVRRADVAGVASAPFTVHSKGYRPPAASYKGQHLNPGYGYLKTRDGTLLSYTLRLPGPPDKGPYPTVVEYSGYDPSNPYDWSGTAPSQHIASILGYAVIGVNLRGSGCSGGSFRIFEEQQALDGYDVVETVAAQPWVLNHKVGLVGLSYPGNMAVLTAERQPPSLAGIAVGGTVDDSLRYLLRPGGILNNGFARDWVKGRYEDANPATLPDWVKKRIAEGDKTCAANQRLRSQNVSVLNSIDHESFLPLQPPGFADSMAPGALVGKIKVPVFLVSTWQDEQVASHVGTVVPQLTGTAKKHIVFTNGGHAEMFAVPDIIARWQEFLDFYVRRSVPNGTVMKAIAPTIGQQVLGSKEALTSLPFPRDRFTGLTYPQALAKYEAEPQVHIAFENGAGLHGVAPGLPDPSFTKDFATYPIPGTQASRWWFGPEGTLTERGPSQGDGTPDSSDSYVSDPSARPRTSTTGGGDWAQFPAYNWAPPVPGKSLAYLTSPLASTMVMAGSGSVDLWLRSSAADTDVQVTLSEVRPDGKETYVQSGWIRGTARALDPTRSTVLQPIGTGLQKDSSPLPTGEFVPMRIELYPFAHVFRAGSRLRLIITAPGGDRIAWKFATLPGTQVNEVARSTGRPSSIVLPVIPNVAVPTGLPACPGLRGQPCRTYIAPS